MSDLMTFLGVLSIGALWGTAMLAGYYIARRDERDGPTVPCLWEEEA